MDRTHVGRNDALPHGDALCRGGGQGLADLARNLPESAAGRVNELIMHSHSLLHVRCSTFSVLLPRGIRDDYDFAADDPADDCAPLPLPLPLRGANTTCSALPGGARGNGESLMSATVSTQRRNDREFGA